MTADLQLALAAGVILGVVQGISEWLPISSKTQVLIASNLLLGLSFTQAYTLGLFLELGTFFAALVFFRKEVKEVVMALIGKGGKAGRLLLKYLVVVTVITGILGVIIYKAVESLSFGSAIGIPMIILGAVLILDGLFITFSRKRAAPNKKLEDLTLGQMAVVGFMQGVAALPGVSRSGATASTMLVMGTEASEAFRLSFLAGIPATLGASLVAVLFSSTPITGTADSLPVTTIVIALAVSFVLSLFVIRWLLKVASSEKITTLVFALGALAIASGIIGLIFGGSINASGS